MFSVNRVKKWFKSLFFNPEKEFATLWLELKVLRDFLEELTRTKDPLLDIVAFFNSTSQWQDRDHELLGKAVEAFDEVNYGQFNRVLNCLGTLRLHIDNSGRDKCGMNRTDPFETVTPDKVFLGDIFGLWTKNVAYWVTTKDGPKDGWKSGTWGGDPAVVNKNAHDVISDKARSFMLSHCVQMIEIIDLIPWVMK